MKNISEKKSKSSLSLRKIILITSVFIIVGVTVINLLFHFSLIDTKWEGGDALAFYGSIFSGVGTIVLGFIAWKQNERLLAIEEDIFLHKNTCALLIRKIEINPRYHRVTGLESYSGLILEENICLCDKYDLLEVVLTTENIDLFPAFVRIDSLYLQIEDKEFFIDISAKKADDSFAVVSNHKDSSVIDLVIKLRQGECKAISEMWEETSCILIVDAQITLVTNKYVASDIEVRTSQKVSGSILSGVRKHEEDKYEDIKKPMLFWKNCSRLNKDQMTVKGLEKQVYDNSKTRKNNFM